MAKLLSRPKIVRDINGNFVPEASLIQREWSRQVTCGKLDFGCGAKQDINTKDIFKKVTTGSNSTQIEYRCKCLHCHRYILINPEGVPVAHRALPDKRTWLRLYFASLVKQLHTECDPNSRQRLYRDLLQDGLNPTDLDKYDWS